MKKLLIIVGIVVVAIIAYWLISPLFITKRVDEKMEDITPALATIETISQGTFAGLAGHNG